MARKTTRRKERSQPSAPKPPRQRIIDAFMALLAEQPIEKIGLADVASGAGVTLAELRDAFSSTLAIACRAHEGDRPRRARRHRSRHGGRAARERLFDVLMRRLDALADHKQAIRSLMRSAGRNPGLAFALNGLAVRSQQWMLTAADISAAGPRGMLRAQGLACLFASVARTWVDDDDPGHARTMAALDRALARGQRWSGFLDESAAIPARVCRARPRRRRAWWGRGNDRSVN